MQTINAIPVLGEKGPNVTALQDALIKLGYKIQKDGAYGAQTNSAVVDLQRKNGMPGSGKIGPRTLGLLGLTLSVSNTENVVNSTPITQDLKGRKSRFLHPKLRAQMEAKIFPNGKIPQSFLDKDITNMVLATAAGLETLKIREVGGNNKGPMVGSIQSIIGGNSVSGTGDPWCMSLVQCLIAFIEDYLQVESPVMDSEHCMTVLNQAKKIPGLVTDKCERASIIIWQRGVSQSGHTGMVMQVLPSNNMKTYEGNTGDGNMRDGDGAYYRVRNQKASGLLKVRGFIRLYPNKV